MHLNNVALVTGCSSGIGHATAIALRQAGFIVCATAPDVNDLNDLREIGCQTLSLDVTDPSQAAFAVRQAEAHNGAVQVLINNAGYGQYGPIEEIPINDVRRNFETNVFGLLRLCQLVLPGMRQGGGAAGSLMSARSPVK